MGSSADATLVYGYYFGGPDSDSQFEEGDVLSMKTPWFDPEEDDDFTEKAAQYLLRTIGEFTETDWQAEGYWDRRRAAEAHLGVQFATGGGDHSTVEYLVAYQESADWGEPVYVDFDELEAWRKREDWDRKLQLAVDTLGLTPIRKPGWIVFSYYG